MDCFPLHQYRHLFLFDLATNRIELFLVFCQVSGVLKRRESSVGGYADDLTAVRNHTDQMLCLLAEERPAGGDIDSSG